jgi:hypothetical protein
MGSGRCGSVRSSDTLVAGTDVPNGDRNVPAPYGLCQGREHKEQTLLSLGEDVPDGDRSVPAPYRKRVLAAGVRYTAAGTAAPRKLPSSRRPACWLFSGWNWVATTAPERMALANFSPYSVCIAMIAGSAGSGK